MSNVAALARVSPRRPVAFAIDTVTRNLRLDGLAARFGIDALVVVEVGGSMLDASGDPTTCRALAAFAVSRTTNVPDVGGDGDTHLHCGRVCVSKQTIYGRDVLIALIGRKAGACTPALVSGVIAAVVEANDRVRADESGTFRVVNAAAP